MNRKKVVMVGPDPYSRGGMATVIDTYLRHGFLSGGDAIFLRTQSPNSFAHRAAVLLLSLLRYMALLLTGRVALMHAHVASGKSFWRKALFLALSYIFRRPVIFHLHGGEFAVFIDQRLSKWQRKLALALLKRVKCFLVLTESSKALMERLAPGIPVIVFPNPIQVPERLKATVVRNQDVLFIGGVTLKKGAFDLLAAFERVHSFFPEARLVVCGSGDIEGLCKAAKLAGCEDKVHFAGWVNELQRNQWLAASAVYVLSSHFEQMPMSVLEAMAAGCPVVATRVGAVPEMIDPGVSGRVVEVGDIGALADAIMDSLRDRSVSENIADRAYQRVREHHEARKVVMRLKDLYYDYAAR